MIIGFWMACRLWHSQCRRHVTVLAERESGHYLRRHALYHLCCVPDVSGMPFSNLLTSISDSAGPQQEAERPRTPESAPSDRSGRHLDSQVCNRMTGEPFYARSPETQA